jgi:flagellar basal-body rod modification protein FlgD
MPSVDPATSSMYTNTAYNKTNSDPSSLDKNGFLKMLTAQMSNQDPTSGQDPNQYFQTISMMTQVEQMTNMATAQTAALSRQKDTNAQNMLGKQVTYASKDPATGASTSVTGTVQSVQFDATKGPSLTVDGVTGVNPDSITNIENTSSPAS